MTTIHAVLEHCSPRVRFDFEVYFGDLNTYPYPLDDTLPFVLEWSDEDIAVFVERMCSAKEPDTTVRQIWNDFSNILGDRNDFRDVLSILAKRSFAVEPWFIEHSRAFLTYLHENDIRYNAGAIYLFLNKDTHDFFDYAKNILEERDWSQDHLEWIHVHIFEHLDRVDLDTANLLFEFVEKENPSINSNFLERSRDKFLNVFFKCNPLNKVTLAKLQELGELYDISDREIVGRILQWADTREAFLNVLDLDKTDYYILKHSDIYNLSRKAMACDSMPECLSYIKDYAIEEVALGNPAYIATGIATGGFTLPSQVEWFVQHDAFIEWLPDYLQHLDDAIERRNDTYIVKEERTRILSSIAMLPMTMDTLWPRLTMDQRAECLFHHLDHIVRQSSINGEMIQIRRVNPFENIDSIMFKNAIWSSMYLYKDSTIYQERLLRYADLDYRQRLSTCHPFVVTPETLRNVDTKRYDFHVLMESLSQSDNKDMALLNDEDRRTAFLERFNLVQNANTDTVLSLGDGILHELG